MMRVIQLVDNLFMQPQRDTIVALDETARGLGFDSRVCAGAFPAELKGLVSPKSVLLDMADDDLLILHVGRETTQCMLDYLLAKGLKCVYHYSVPDSSIVARSDPFLAREIERGEKQLSRMLKDSDFCIVSAGKDVDAIHSLGFAGKTFVSQPVIDGSFYDPFFVSDVRRSDTIVLVGGEFGQFRNYGDVLRAYALFQSQYGQSCTLAIAGDFAVGNPYIAALLEYASDLGVEKCRLFNSFDYFVDLLPDADVFFSLSDTEEDLYGMVLSMRAGVPIVAYRASLAEELVQGVGIVLNTKDYINAASALLVSVEDETSRGIMVENGLSRAEIYGRPAAEKRLEAILASMNRRA